MDWQSLAAEIRDPAIPLIEINAATCGDLVVLPWRDDYVSAAGRAYQLLDGIDAITDWPPGHYLLQVEKSRQATIEAARYLWSRMPQGAELLVLGPNSYGIKSTLKQLAECLACEPEMLLNKKRARLVRFRKDVGEAEPYSVQWQQIPADADSAQQLWSRPGVFSARELDTGTELLQECLSMETPARRIVDLACGVGHLGCYALRQWPAASCHFCDADARALSCLRRSIDERDWGQRASTQWWAAGEDIACAPCDLVLMNPPAHKGKAVSYQAAQQMFIQGSALLQPGGSMLIVANQQLPYERELLQLPGQLEAVMEDSGYKVLRFRKGSSHEAPAT